jgi:hypothetical protein
LAGHYESLTSTPVVLKSMQGGTNVLQKSWYCLAVMLVFTGTLGCTSGSDTKLVAVTGKVTRQGAPVSGALVTFIPSDGSVSSFGTTDAEGKFTLATARGEQGASVGAAVATVSKTAAGATSTLTGPPAEVMKGVTATGAPAESATAGGGVTPTEGPVAGSSDELPAKYASMLTSGLNFTVTDDPSKNNFEIVLE